MTAMDRLADVVAKADDPGRVHAATDAVRDALDDALRGRRLTEGSVLLSRANRVREGLDTIDRAVADGRWEQARDAVETVAPLHERVLGDAAELPEAETTAAWTPPPVLRNAGTVAYKETVVVVQGVRGLILAGLFLLTFGVGLEAALAQGGVGGVQASVELVWSYAHSLDFIAAPLGGLLVGHALINEERNQGTIQFLASKPIRREGIVLGKWLGMAAALGLIVGLAALIVGGVAFGLTGALGDPGVVLGYVAATYLLALAFGALAMVVSAVLSGSASSLGAGFGAFVLLGPVWQNLFLIRSLGASSASPPVGRLLVYLASPFTAWWNWTSELLGPRSEVLGLPVGEPWHAALVEAVERGQIAGLPFYAQQSYYVLVLVLWAVLGLVATLLVVERQDLT